MEQDKQDRRKARIFENIDDNALLKIAAHLINLTLQPGWATWEGMVRESREAALENLANCGPDDVRYWQGYVSALAGILSGPDFIFARAKEIQDETQETTGMIKDHVRVSHASSELSI